MKLRFMLLACLVFSGLSALVYQVLWTRLLGFVFGTTTEAIASMLAVFFAGMALGNLWAARALPRIERPFRAYAALELFIGVYAALTLPVLLGLDAVYAWVGVDHAAGTMSAIRLAISAAILLPPTIAMGATLPVVARGLIETDSTLGRWSAYLYSANTVGAVLGAYLCGFWMIPWLGLTHTLLLAAAVNSAVALAVFLAARTHRAEPWQAIPTPKPQRGSAFEGRGFFLACFGVSGFVAIGYEIVWSKIFTIVMEGTLYGFATVLAAYLFGLALGSLAMSRRVDRIRDLPRAFGWLHIGIGASVAAGIWLVADLPHWHFRMSPAGANHGIHALFLVVAPIILLPTALFGAAFPVLIRLYTDRAGRVGEGVGVATAINTAGSIAASLAVGFVLIPGLGIDATLYLLLLVELFVGVAVLLRFQTTEGRERAISTLAAFAVLVTVSLSYQGVRVERAVAGRGIEAPTLEGYRAERERRTAHTALVIEGKGAVVTVDALPSGWSLQSNGMPEAGFSYAPPHRGLETLLLGIIPYVTAAETDSALIIGFGGGATLDALRRTGVREIEVVELEKGVLDVIPLLYRGRENPLEDPRVRVTRNDGRNELLLNRYRAEPRRYDLIASQPSHPWRSGSANLFTREYFELARESLAPGGAFAAWVNGFHTDADSLLAVLASFEAVFPGAVLLTSGGDHPHSSFLLVGRSDPVEWDLEQIRRRMAEPGVRSGLALHGITSVEELLARSEGPAAAFRALPGVVENTDDAAFVETRLSRVRSWKDVDWREVESRLAPDTPVLPPLRGELDWNSLAQALYPDGAPRRAGDLATLPKLRRLMRDRRATLDAEDRATWVARSELWDRERSPAAVQRLRDQMERNQDDAAAARAVGLFASARGDSRVARDAFAEAWRRSGSHSDALAVADALLPAHPLEAWKWSQRVPESVRREDPETALVNASYRLAGGKDPAVASLRALYDSLERARALRRDPQDLRYEAALTALSRELGDEVSARRFADLEFRIRRERAEPLLQRARKALQAEQLDSARALLREAGRWLPANSEIIELNAQVAARAADRPALAAALRELRATARSARAGIAAENRLRALLELPLLPEQPPAAIASKAEIPAALPLP